MFAPLSNTSCIKRLVFLLLRFTLLPTLLAASPKLQFFDEVQLVARVSTVAPLFLEEILLAAAVDFYLWRQKGIADVLKINNDESGVS